MNNHSMRTKPLMEWLKNASAPAQREDGIGKGAFANFVLKMKIPCGIFRSIQYNITT